MGAGLPVMVTLERLLACGDPLQRITGTLSGTSGYLMSGLEGGAVFSQLVEEARRLGVRRAGSPAKISPDWRSLVKP